MTQKWQWESVLVEKPCSVFEAVLDDQMKMHQVD